MDTIVAGIEAVTLQHAMMHPPTFQVQGCILLLQLVFLIKQLKCVTVLLTKENIINLKLCLPRNNFYCFLLC